MIDHIGIVAGDFDASKAFYDAALAALGITTMMEVTPAESGGYHGIGYGKDAKPFFWVSNLGAPAGAVHVAFSAPTRPAVDAFYEAAIKAGGRDNGAPGLRPHYHPNYYAAFVIDPDGHNVEAVCHLLG